MSGTQSESVCAVLKIGHMGEFRTCFEAFELMQASVVAVRESEFQDLSAQPVRVPQAMVQSVSPSGLVEQYG